MTSDADEKMLDQTFARMRDGDVSASDALLDRIMLDADQVLAQAQAHAVQQSDAPTLTLADMIRDAIGGWPTLGGLAAATVAGVWIGVAQPASFTDLSAGLWGSTIEVPLLESDIFSGLEG